MLIALSVDCSMLWTVTDTVTDNVRDRVSLVRVTETVTESQTLRDSRGETLRV